METAHLLYSATGNNAEMAIAVLDKGLAAGKDPQLPDEFYEVIRDMLLAFGDTPEFKGTPTN